RLQGRQGLQGQDQQGQEVTRSRFRQTRAAHQRGPFAFSREGCGLLAQPFAPSCCTAFSTRRNEGTKNRICQDEQDVSGRGFLIARATTSPCPLSSCTS